MALLAGGVVAYFALGRHHAANRAVLPRLGEPFEIKRPGRKLVIAAGQACPFDIITVDGVIYEVAVSSAGTVGYISTRDPSFRTDEGFSVSSTMEDLDRVGVELATFEPGWAYKRRLSSGWTAGFYRNTERSNPDSPPKDFPVSFFFKRGSGR